MRGTLRLTGRLFKADLSDECAPNDDPRHVRDARAWNRATDRHCAEIARQTGIRAETIRAWGRPQSENRESPTSRMHRVLRAARECGAPEADVLAPVELIAADFHRGLAARVPIVGRLVSQAEASSSALAEIADVVRAVAEGLPGGFSNDERAAVKKEIREAMDELLALDNVLDNAEDNHQ